MSKDNTAYLNDIAKTLKDACRSGHGCGIMVYTNKGPNDCQCPFDEDCDCLEVTANMWKKALKEMKDNA